MAMTRLPLVLLAVSIVTIGCDSYSAWLRETIDARPDLDDRVHTPHRVAILETGRDAFDVRIERIRAASQTIKLQTFILDDSTTTRLLFHELVGAARRGVRVQFLADTMFSAKNIVYAARLATAHENLELRVYNPSSDHLVTGTLSGVGIAVRDFERLNQRMHNKTMTVDGSCGICGGRNYQDHYFDQDLKLDYRDRDILVFGEVVADMDASFDTYWNHPASVPITALTDVADAVDELADSERGWPFSRAELEIDAFGRRVDARLAAPGGVPVRWFGVDHIAFWADTAGKPSIDEDEHSVARRLIGAIGSAEHHVLMQSPYLVMTDAALTLFEQLRDRGVRLGVHTNSLASTDSWPAYGHALRQRREMLEDLELEIFELEPYPDHLREIVPGYDVLAERATAARADGQDEIPAAGPILSLHAKSMVVDDRLAVIGSYNLDPRSETWNTEVLVAVWDDEFAAELARSIRKDAAPGNSWVVAPRDRGLPRLVLAELAEGINQLVKSTTTLDLWPVEWSELHALRPDAEPVSRFDDTFHDRYEGVGAFPEVGLDRKLILVQLARSLTGFARSLM